jgi:hypothetical protein
VTVSSGREESAVSAVSAALSPFKWRGFTAEQLARFVLAADDRQGLADLLVRVPGVEVGPWEEPEPVSAEDPRVKAIVDFLDCHRWTQLTLDTLSRHLVSVVRGAP